MAVLLQRSGKDSLELKFDVPGAQALLQSAQAAEHGREQPVPAEIDWAIFRSRQGHPSFNGLLGFQQGHNEMWRQEHSVILAPDGELLESAIESLKKCIQTGVFSPAEFLSFVLRNKKLRYHIFCELITDANQRIL